MRSAFNIPLNNASFDDAIYRLCRRRGAAVGGTMTKLICGTGAICLLISAFGCNEAGAQTQWVGPKLYTPPAVTMILPPLAAGGLPIGPIDVLPPGTPAIFVERNLRNVTARPLPAGYGTSEKVIRLVFTSFAGRAGWMPGIGPAFTIATVTTAGPPLAPGATAPVGFGPIALPGCGMYQETLTAPGDKQARRFLVPGTVSITATVNPPVPDIIDESAPAKGFRITFTGVGGTMWVFGPTQPKVMGSMGSTGAFNPRPTGRAAAPVAAFNTTYTVTPNDRHGRLLCTDILNNFVLETVNSLLTAISADGCFVQQVALTISVRHACQGG
jgi:hypothetical protein